MEQVALIVSIVSGVAGVSALVVALRANYFAKKSLAKALEANDFAKEANDYSDRAEARELERNDVDWDWRDEGVGWVVLFNGGQDTAYKVRAVMSVDEGEEQVRTADEVPPSGELAFEFPVAARARARKVAKTETQTGVFSVANFAAQQGEFLHIKITWETALGRPREWSPRLASTTLGVEY